MSLIRQRNSERRLGCVDTRRSGRRTASVLSERTCRLLDAAQELERATGKQYEVRADSGAVTAIEQMGPALEAVANANLLLSLQVRELVIPEPRVRSQDEMAEPSEPTGGDEVDRATRLLFGASQNIRIAAEASKLAAAAVRSAAASPE
ncbi:MAG: hypothetical protein ACRDMH_17385 [Solirubrobacterales bacterium]